jgi:hypothetical protein
MKQISSQAGGDFARIPGLKFVSEAATIEVTRHAFLDAFAEALVEDLVYLPGPQDVSRQLFRRLYILLKLEDK